MDCKRVTSRLEIMFQSERIGKPGEIKGGENVLLLAYLVSAPFLLLVSIRFRCLTYDKEKKKRKKKRIATRYGF